MRTVRQRTGHSLPEKRGAARIKYHHRRHHGPRCRRNHPFHPCFNITTLIKMAVNIIAIVFLSLVELGRKLGNEVKGVLLSTCMIIILFPISSCRFFFSQWNKFSSYSLKHFFFFISCFALQGFLASLPPHDGLLQSFFAVIDYISLTVLILRSCSFSRNSINSARVALSQIR